MILRNKILSVICFISLLLATIISIINFWCFNKAFYLYEYENLNTAESIGISSSDLNKTTDVLMNYLKEENSTLDIEVNIKGQLREVFNKREKDHMVDVKNLYNTCMKFRNYCVAVYAFCMILLVINKGLNSLYKGYLKALGIFGAIFAFAGIFCLIDFDSFWLEFHHIFFPSNDLWLLDPRTDVLIMMVPSKFFFDLCISIIFSIFLLMLIYFIIIKILDKKVFNK